MMKIDCLMPAAMPDQVAAATIEFERLGFDGVWTFEATNDAFFPLAYAAANTSKIDLGTNIAVAFARTPFAMAQTAWDLQRYSNGRFHLGLGTQVRAHVERRFSAAFEHPAARVTDYIRCVRAIWDTFQNQTRPNYQGPFYQFKLINPFFDPGPLPNPRIPIYLAGVNPRMCRAAGEVADGFHVHPMHSAGYLRDVVRPALDEGAKTRNLRVSDMTLYSPVFVISGETQAEIDTMTALVRKQVSFYGTTPSYAAVLEYHGYHDLGKQLGSLMREGKMDEMAAAVPDALLEQVAVIGKPGEIGSMIRNRYEGLLDRVSLYMTMGGDGNFSRWSELIAAIHAG